MKKVIRLTEKNVGNFVRILRSSNDETDRQPELYRIVQCQKGEPDPQVLLDNLISGERISSPTVLVDGKPFFFYALLSIDEAHVYLDECHKMLVVVERFLLDQQREVQITSHQTLMAFAKLVR